jgi:hypothetical protein
LSFVDTYRQQRSSEAVMDQHERSMARARAEWRAKRAGKTSNSP